MLHPATTRRARALAHRMFCEAERIQGISEAIVRCEMALKLLRAVSEGTTRGPIETSLAFRSVADLAREIAPEYDAELRGIAQSAARGSSASA